jgi:hypothetical protein
VTYPADVCSDLLDDICREVMADEWNDQQMQAYHTQTIYPGDDTGVTCRALMVLK